MRRPLSPGPQLRSREESTGGARPEGGAGPRTSEARLGQPGPGEQCLLTILFPGPIRVPSNSRC